MNEPSWKSFELAVEGFIKSLDPKAKVTHDVKLPDAQTGKPRQRDVWVEWNVLGHYPAKALISCKDWGKVLDQQDIDHFRGEFLSANAQIGIIYSRSGFNQNALEKAKALGFHCCRLYEDEPADIPESIAFGLAYCIRSRPELRVGEGTDEWGLQTWQDILNLEPDGVLLSDQIKEFWTEYQIQDEKRFDRATKLATSQWELIQDSLPNIVVACVIHDDAYRAKVEYHRIDGSYNLTHGHFLGTQTTPSIDTQNQHPGEGWTPTQLTEADKGKALTMFFWIDIDKFLEEVGPHPIKDSPDISADPRTD